MKKIAISFLPLYFIFIIWFFFATPYFFKGSVPYPSKYQVTFFAPWSHYEKWWGPVKNNAMPDIITQIYPWKHFTINSLKKGIVPFWNPYSFSGNAHLANFQSAVYSPFNLLYFILPFLHAWSMTILLQPLIAGICTYLLLKELKVSSIGSIIGSVTFMFCGFMVVWMEYGTLSMAAAFLPLGLYGIEKSFNTSRKRFFILTCISLVISFFSGHIQTSLYVAIYVLLYLFYKSFMFLRYDKKDKIFFIIFWGFISFFLGILISFLQIYPTFNLFQISPRSETAHLGGGIPLNYLVTMIAPDFYGNPVTRNDWYGTYAEWSSFIGIIPLLLGFISILTMKFKHSTLFFFFMAILTICFSIESPLHILLIASHIPVLASSIPSRIIVLFSFSFAILAGFGLDSLVSLIEEKKKLKVFFLFVIFGMLIFVIWLLLTFFPVLPIDKLSIAKKNFLAPTLLFFIVVIFVYFDFIVKRKRYILFTSLIILFLCSVDSFRFANKWIPFDKSDLVFPDVPVISAMQKNVGNGRVFGNLGTEVSTYYGLGSIEGYDPLYIQRYGEFIRYSETGQFVSAEKSVVHIARNGKYTDRVLDLLAVNIIFHPIADTNQSWAYHVWSNPQKYSVIYQDDKFQLYKNNTALPRVQLYYSYEVVSDKDAILKRFYDDNFDFRKILLLETDPKVVLENKLVTTSRNKAIISLYSPTKIKVDVYSDKPGLLFLSDPYYEKWHAVLNGKETKILRSNYAFRSVIVPEGKSEVEFFYKEY